jgi:hypothetical protein
MAFDNEYKEELRKRLGLEADDSSRDEYLQGLRSIDRFRMILAYRLGHDNWIYAIEGMLNSQGLCIAEKTDKIGVGDPLLKKVEIL